MAAQRLGDQGALEVLHRRGQRPRAGGLQVAEGRRTGRDAEHAAVGHVAQLAHIARPVVGQQPGLARRVGGGQRALVARGRLQQEMLEQQRDVLAPLAQRRQRQRDDAEPVVEVGAKAPLVRQRLQVGLGRCHHPAIDRDQGVGAQPLQAALLQHAQQLDLQRDRHRLDLVEEQGAAAGVLDLADAALAGPGVGAGLVAEDLALEQGFGQAAAVDGDEIALASRAGLVQAARHQFLAAAGLALDQDVGGAVAQVRHQLAHPRHRRRATDQLGLEPVAAVQPGLELAQFQRQAALVQCPAHHLDQQVGRERLLDEVVCAVLHRLHRQRHVAMAGDQHHRQLGIDLAQGLEQGHAVQARQPDVADHHAGKVGPDAALRLLGAGHAADRDVLELQGLLAAQPYVGVVLDQQHLQGVIHVRAPGQWAVPG